DDRRPALVLARAERRQLGGDPVRVALERGGEQRLDLGLALGEGGGLAGVDRGAVDAVVDLAGHGGGELALGLGPTVAGQEERVVEQAAGPRHRRGEGEHPEVDAVRAGLGGEGVALRSEERRVGKECRYRWRS